MRDLGLYCCKAPADTRSMAVPLLSRVAPVLDLLFFAKHLIVEAICSCCPTPSGSIRTALRRMATRRRTRPRWRPLQRVGGGAEKAWTGQLAARFRTIQVCPKDLRALPGHPEPAVSWPGGFRGGAHARPKATPVHHAHRRRGCSVAARRARAAAGDAGDRVFKQRVAGVRRPPVDRSAA